MHVQSCLTFCDPMDCSSPELENVNTDLGNISQTRAKVYLNFNACLLKAPNCFNSFSFLCSKLTPTHGQRSKIIFNIHSTNIYWKFSLRGYAWPCVQDHHSLEDQEKNFESHSISCDLKCSIYIPGVCMMPPKQNYSFDLRLSLKTVQALLV